MSREVVHVLIIVAVGLGATLVMDLCALFLRSAFSVSFPNYCLVGRWLLHMPGGRFRHANIAAAAPKPAECATGWIAHYATGVLYGLLLVFVAPGGWLQEPTLLPAMLVGLLTVAVPFLVMQPCFGLGIASSRAPSPAQARLRSVMSHALFGFGLYVSALAIGWLQQE